MFQRLKQRLALPVFEDEDQARRARLLATIVGATVSAVGTLTLVTTWLTPVPDSLLRLGIGSLACAVIGAFYFLIQRRRLRLASLLLPSLALALLTGALLLLGGLRSPVVSGYVTVIAIASLLLGGRGALVFALLSGLAALGVYVAEINGVLVNPAQASTGLRAWLVHAGLFGLTGFLMRQAARSLQEGMENARRLRAAEAERARELDALLAAERKRARQMELLTHTVRKLVSLDDMQALVDEAMQRLHEDFGYENVGLLLVEDEALVLRAIRSPFADLIPLGTRMPLGEGVIGWVAAAGQTVVINDTASDPRYRALPGARMGAELAVPLRLGQSVIGVLNVESERRGAFDAADVRTLESIADLLAAALQSGQLFAEVRARERMSRALQAVGAAVTASLDLSTVLDTICVEIRAAFEVDGVIVWLTEGEALLAVAAHGPGAEQILGQRFSLTDPTFVSGRAIRERRPVFVNDLQQSPDGSPRLRAITSAQAVLAMPILTDAQILGALTIFDTRQPQRFGSRELIAAELLSGQLTVAIQNARAFDAAQRRARQTALLNDITRTALETSDLHQMLQALADRLGALLEADDCYITLWDEAAQRTIPTVASRAMRETYPAIQVEPGELTMTESVLRAGRVLVAEDVFASPYVSPRVAARFLSRSLLGLPLLAGEQKLGAALIAFHQPHHFTPDEIALGEQAAQHIALALTRARALEAERRRSAELEALRQASLRLTASLELQPVLEAILVQALNLVSADDAHIFLYDGERLTFGAARWAGNMQQEPYAEVRPHGLTATVARSGERVVVSEARTHPLFQDRPWDGAIAGFPLRVGEQVRGVMNVAFTRPHHFDDNELRVLELLADQAAIALDNVRLFEAARRRAAQLSLLGEVSRQVAGSLDEAEIFQRTVEALVNRFGFAEAGIVLPVGEGDLELAATAGTEDLGVAVGFRQKVGEGVIGHAAEIRATYVANDISCDPHYFSPAGRRTGSALGVPLQREGELLGLLYIESSRAGAFNPDDVLAIETLAQHVATALENARLYSRARARLHEMTVLQSVSQAVTSWLELPQIFQTVVQLLQDVLGYQYISLYQLAGDTLRLGAQTGYPPEFVLSEIPVTAGVAGRAARTRQAQFIRDVNADPDFLRASEAVCSEISVPLLKEQTVLGVLNVESGPDRPLTEADVDLLAILASQVTVAIDNARLFAAEREQRRLAEALRVGGVAMSASLDFDTVLDLVLDQIAHVVPYDSANVMLVEQGRVRIARQRGYERFGPFQQDPAAVQLDLATTPNLRWMSETGKPLIIPDTASDPGWLRSETWAHVLSWAGAPITVQGQVIAFFSLDKNEAGFYRPEHAEHLAAFAGQSALALQNARLFEAERRRADELSVLHAVAAAGAAATSEDELIERVTQVIGATLFPDNFGVMLLDEAAGALRVHPAYRASAEVEQRRDAIPLGRGITGRVAATGVPRRVADVTREPDLVPDDTRTRSELCVPLRVGERIIGVINAESMRVAAFSEADERLLITVAGQLATAIENVRLFAMMAEGLAREQHLNEMARTVSRTLDLPTVLPGVVRLAAQLVGAEAGSMALASPDGQTMTYPYLFNLPEALTSAPTPKGQGMSWHIVMTGEAVLMDDYAAHPQALPHWVEAGVRGVIGVPLVVGESRIGALGLFKLSPGRRFTRRDLALAESVGRQAGVAIQNARLYEAEQRRAEEQRLLLGATREFTAGLSEEAVLRATVHHMVNALRVAGCAVSLWEPAEDRVVTLLDFDVADDTSLDHPGATYALADYPATRRVLESRQPHLLDVNDPAADPAERALLRRLGYERSLMLPLAASEQVFGLVELSRRGGAPPFTEREVQLAQNLAAQAAAALENARLHTAVKERARELDALLGANAALLSTLELDPLLHNILAAAIDAIPAAEKGTILLVDAATGQLQIRAVVGYADPRVHTFAFASQEGYSAKALRQRQPLLIADAQADASIRYAGEIPEVREILSAVAAPLMLHRHAAFDVEPQPFGVISLDATRRAAFSQTDLRLLGAFANTAAVAIDHARLHAEVQTLAVTDGLTGLANHRAFERALRTEVSRALRYGHPLALIFLDIDSFKQYNDTYGHPAGNERLKAIAALLRQNVRDPDVAARYGGEEFAVILPHTNKVGALILAERIRSQAAAAAPEAAGAGEPVSGYTLSLGVAAFPDDADTPEALLLAADSAELAAKREGKNRVCAAPPRRLAR